MDIVDDIVEAVVQQYHICSHYQVDEIDGGASRKSESIRFLITQDGWFPIKRLKVRDKDHARYVAFYTKFLQSRGFPTLILQKPYSNPDQPESYFVEIDHGKTWGTRYYTLESWAAGRDLKRKDASPETLGHVGRLIGKLHKANGDFTCDGDCPASNFTRRLETVVNSGRWRPKPTKVLTAAELEFVDELTSEIEEFWTTDRLETLGRQQPILGDLNFANMKFNDDREVVAIFDLDKACWGWRIEDLHAPLVRTGRPNERIHTDTLASDLESLLKGYESEAERLSEPEREALPRLSETIVFSHVVNLVVEEDLKNEKVVEDIHDFLYRIDLIRRNIRKTAPRLTPPTL